MEKYKALKEYIKKCGENDLEIKIINNTPVRISYSQINADLNALLKEYFNDKT